MTLRRLTKSGWRVLQDERQVRGTANSFTFFVRERFASEDFKGIPGKIAMERIGTEWKEIPESEKKVSCYLF